ncbi:hypothetical protein BTVI_66787 [Pitangus sulphuratus]|nr:hypothetical protein BTVI_66787 [Pitangus sulphuratus]
MLSQRSSRMKQQNAAYGFPPQDGGFTTLQGMQAIAKTEAILHGMETGKASCKINHGFQKTFWKSEILFHIMYYKGRVADADVLGCQADKAAVVRLEVGAPCFPSEEKFPDSEDGVT